MNESPFIDGLNARRSRLAGPLQAGDTGNTPPR